MGREKQGGKFDCRSRGAQDCASRDLGNRKSDAVRLAGKRIYEKAPEVDRPDVSWYRPLMDDFTPSRGRSGSSNRKKSTVLLSQQEERALFLKFNFSYDFK